MDVKAPIFPPSDRPMSKIARGMAAVRGSPRLAVGIDAVVATWVRLVDAFCEVIDPYLSRTVPDLRLVATVSEKGAITLHRVRRGSDGRPVAVIETDDVAELRAVKWTAVELRLRPDQVLRRTLSLPGASRDFLGAILEHRLERLTPWKTDHVVYGHRILEGHGTGGADPGVIAVEFVATSRDILAEPLRRLEALGLSPTAVGTSDAPVVEPLRVVLGAGGCAGSPPASRVLVSRALLATFAVLAVLCVASASRSAGARDERDAVAAKLVKARRLLRAAATGAVGEREKAMLDAKTPDRAIVTLVDRLAGAIPPDTYLRELAVTPDKVRLVGLSGHAPALIARLEAAGLANVRFSSGVAREKDGRDHFEIAADRRPGAP